MKTAAACVVLSCLLIVHVEGQLRTSVRRCLCQGPAANVVRIQRIDKVDIYPPSPSCENVEIVVTLKNGAGKRCLNPESKFTKNYLNYLKKAVQKRSAQ